MATARNVDEKNALYEGVSISMLADLFHMDRRKVSAAMRNVEPCGKREGFDIYPLAEAARYLVTPVIDVEEYIKKLRPNDLPPLLSKEFWNGQRARQQYQLAENDLWRTEAVLIRFVEVFSKIRSVILGFEDSIDSKTQLTVQQRQLMRTMLDGLLTDIHTELTTDDYDGFVQEREGDVSDSD